MPLVMITGGARSGKSAAAVRLAASRMAGGSEVVVAVFGDACDDAEMEARIDRHQAERPPGFNTLEATDARSWCADVPGDALLLLDCLGTLTARLMAEQGVSLEDDAAEFERSLDTDLAALIGWLARRDGDTVVVTNEVGCGVVPAYASGRVFRDVLGRANARLATIAEASYLAVCGRLIDLAALPRDVPWPGE